MYEENPSLWMILEPLYYSSHATLAQGDLGFINFVDNTCLAQKSNGTVAGNESRGKRGAR